MQTDKKILRGVVACWAAALCLSAQTTPKEALGFNVGDDYHVANYTQLAAYLKKLAGESNRMKLEDIGLTAEGRHQYMAVVTSAENQKKLDHYKDISKRLALAEGLTDEQAHALAREGKAVIFMDFGLHATETVGSQALIELVYQLVSRSDEETLRFLNDDILLLCLANPDGQELVANWYMREADQARRSLNGVPRLWQKYIGHDNARDMFMSNQPETANINRVLFLEWFPQITHTHHQTGPAGAVVFMPPFRDPFNYNFDPLLPVGVDLVGAAMHSRLIGKGMPGSAMRGASNYSTWWNGGMRTISYFHNMIGLLTEIIGNRTAMSRCPSRRRPGTTGGRSTTRWSTAARYSMSLRAIARRSCTTFTKWAGTRSSGAAGTTGRSRPSASRPRRKLRAMRPRRGAEQAVRAGTPRVADEERPRLRRKSTGRSCTIRRCATRAGTYCPPARPIFRPRRNSSTCCSRMAWRCCRRTRHFRRRAKVTRPVRTW
jgi:hypothetical protein